MAYEVVMPYHLHMPSYFLETFTEYPYYSLRQWTVQSITGDCTVYYGGLYSPLPETVVIFRLKALGRQQETT